MNQERKDISNLADIKLLVNSFYSRVREDVLLGDIFNERIQDRWPQHLEKMYRFWQTVLLEEHTYYGSPFVPHAKLPVELVHFQRWVKLFCDTVDALFTGERQHELSGKENAWPKCFITKLTTIGIIRQHLSYN